MSITQYGLAFFIATVIFILALCLIGYYIVLHEEGINKWIFGLLGKFKLFNYKKGDEDEKE